MAVVGSLIVAVALVFGQIPARAAADGGTGSITGTIYDAVGAPVANVLVFACAGTCAQTTSGGDGTYAIGQLAAGTYRVAIQDLAGRIPGGYATSTGLTTNAGAAILATVGSAPVTLDVHAPGGTRIAGIVTAPAGGGLGDIFVAACLTEVGPTADSDFTPCGLDVTGPDGNYSLAVLRGTYEVYAIDLGNAHATGYYSANGFVFPGHLATRLSVGDTEIGGIDLALPAGAAIAGTAIDATGAPVRGVLVVACLASDIRACRSDTTASDGTYTVAGLLPGSYDVTFIDAGATYPTGFYSTSGFTGDSGRATAVVVGPTGASGIDVQIPVGRVVSGTVTSAAGAAARIEIEDCTSAFCVPVTVTGANGSYRLDLAPGKHAIHVSDYSGASLSGYYSASGLANELHATDLTVSSSGTASINVRLHGITGGIHPGTAHTGSFVRSTTVTKATYATVRFTFGKTFAGTHVTILRAVKSSTGAWSTYRRVATVVVAADGNAYYSTRITGYLGFRAGETDSILPTVQVLSTPVYVHSR